LDHHRVAGLNGYRQEACHHDADGAGGESMEPVDDVHTVCETSHHQHGHEVAGKWPFEQLVNGPHVSMVHSNAEPGVSGAGRDDRKK